MATLKGQNFRILAQLDGTSVSVIGMSTNCTVTLTNNTDDASTKDDVGLAAKPEVVSKAWSVQVDSLNVVNTAAMLTAFKSMNKILVMWDEVSTPTTRRTKLPHTAAKVMLTSPTVRSRSTTERTPQSPCNSRVLPR
jgi:Phage major tail protein 2.